MSSIFDTLYNQQPPQPRASMFDAANQAISAIPQGRPAAPAAKKPGLLDYIWGVAAGYNPNDVGRMFDAREQAAQTAAAQRARQAEVEAYARQQGPASLAAFSTNPEEYGKAVSSGLESYTLNNGAVRYGPGNQAVAAPLRIEKFDDRFGFINPLNPAAGAQYSDPRSQTQSEMLTAAEQAIKQAQFDRTQGLAERQFDVNSGIAQAELGIKQADLGMRQTEAQRAEEQRRTAEAGKATAQMQTADSMEQALTRGREFINSAGAWTGLMPWQRQNRANLEGQIDTLKGNLTFDKLMAMKASSPTGASGLGALSDSEARMLAATVASLSPDMSPSELERSFSVVDGLVKKLRETTPATAGAGARPIAVNPRTGERRQWNGSQWVPL